MQKYTYTYTYICIYVYIYMYMNVSYPIHPWIFRFYERQNPCFVEASAAADRHQRRSISEAS